MTCINIKEALCKILGSLVHWKRILSYESPEPPPSSLGGHSRFLNGVPMTLDIRNEMNKHSGSSVQDFRLLGTLEEDTIVLSVSRASSKESWGHS